MFSPRLEQRTHTGKNDFLKWMDDSNKELADGESLCECLPPAPEEIMWISPWKALHRRLTWTARPQGTLYMREAGRIALLGLCCQPVNSTKDGSTFTKYKTKKLLFTGSELCGWLAMHLSFPLGSTSKEQESLLNQCIDNILELRLLQPTDDASALTLKEIGLNFVVDCAKCSFKVDEEELLQGIQDKLQLENLRIAVDTLSGIINAKEIEQMPTWKKLEKGLCVCGEGDARFVEDENGGRTMTAATLDRLVFTLTSFDTIDTEFRDAFLLTYPTFVDDLTLLCLLRDRWRYQPRIDSEDEKLKQNAEYEKKTIQLRVLNFLKLWVEQYAHRSNDLATKLKLEVILDEIKDIYPSAQKTLMQSIQNAENRTRYQILEDVLPVGPIHLPVTDEQEPALSLPQLLVSDPATVAEQLTVIDHGLFSRIQSDELLFENWTKEERDVLAENICYMEYRFDAIMCWIVSILVSPITQKERVKCLSAVIRFANYLIDQQNFFSAQAVLFALQSASVSRLQRTWDGLSDDDKTALHILSDLFLPDDNYAKYRNHLRGVRPPCVPFVGLILTDLQDIEQSYDDEVDEGLINFEKRLRIAAVLMEVMRFQVVPYSFTPQLKIISQLLYLRPLDAKQTQELHQHSCTLEPEEPEKIIEQLLHDEMKLKTDVSDLELSLYRCEQELEELKEENAQLRRMIGAGAP